MFEDSDEVGIDVVVHNANREVIAAVSEKIPYPSSMDLVEVLAARKAVLFIVDWAYHNQCLKETQR